MFSGDMWERLNMESENLISTYIFNILLLGTE